MALNILTPQDPALSQEIRTFDQSRADEVEQKHQLLIEYLHLRGYDALLLQGPEMFGWLTAGACNARTGSGPHAALFITEEARVVLCNQVDSPQLFDRELNGLGFLLKERPWTDDPHAIRQDCVRTRKVASDVWYPGTENVARELLDFRLKLTTRERDVYRELGRVVAHAVEATARNLQRGDTELDIAGQLSHRLLRHGVQPLQLQVLSDGQGHRYRHWSASLDRIERHCTLIAVGRRHGLHVEVARTIAFGAPTQEVQDTFDVATLLQTTGIYFSQAGWSVRETWQRVQRIYEKFGVPDEWRLAEQAEFTGYGVCEERVLPLSERDIPSACAVCWHPSVRSAHVSDTILVHPQGTELITPHENWPSVTVRVKGIAMNRPGILIREVGAER